MSFQITNQRTAKSFAAQSNETILDAALRAGRILPYGCRGGVCGACKCALVDGRVDYGDYDAETLTADEIARGKVLICQAKPLSDVVIDAEETAGVAGMEIKKLPCRVATLTRAAKDVMRVFLQLPKSQAFNFLPGQYIDIILKDGKRRSFSIANLPAQAAADGLELHIRQVSGGHFSPRVFNSLRARDLLRLEGPFGSYVLQSASGRPMLMVAGGTGFAPIKSLILQALEQNPRQRMHLFWGARDRQDLYMHRQAEQWARDYENFSYTPVLSESVDADWRGARGWVHETVAANFDTVADMDIYASGPPVMIESLRESLRAKEMQAGRFFFDAFTYAEQP